MGKSHQAGWVSLRGKQWFGYFRERVLDPETGEDRVKKVCVKLALKSKMTKLKARDALKAEISQADRPEPRGQNPERRICHLRVVCPQPLFSASQGRLAARNGEGEDGSD